MRLGCDDTLDPRKGYAVARPLRGPVEFAVAGIRPGADRAAIPLRDFPAVARRHGRHARREPFPAMAEA
jgi:hypothetical protein